MLPRNPSACTNRSSAGEVIRVRHLLLRILKNGLLTAVILAVLGYVLAEGAGVWVGSQPTLRPHAEPGLAASPGPAPPEQLAGELRTRLPFSLAGWGFLLVVLFEVLAHVWRGGKAPPTRTPKTPVADETEKLLNELLAKAEAAEAQKKAASQTPVPADNVGVTP
jgi:hypothetical protein